MPSQLNFHTIIPASVIDVVYSYVEIPVFSYEGIIWKGASEIVTQFNYEASKNFTIRELPVMPTGVNFVPVISYRIGLTTFRYKLWADIGEVLAEELYNGQVIKKNFKIEIWNIATSQSVDLEEVLQLLTSIRTVPTDFNNIVNIEEDETPTEVSQQHQISENPTSPPTSGLLAWYNTGSGAPAFTTSGANIIQWDDSSGNGNHLTNPSGVNRAQTLLVDGFLRVSVSAAQWLSKESLANFTPYALYIVSTQNVSPVNGVVFAFEDTDYMRLRVDSTGDFIQAGDAGGVYDNTTIVAAQKCLFHQRFFDDSEEHIIKKDLFFADTSDGTVIGTLSAATPGIFVGDAQSVVNSATQTIFEILVYSSELSEADHLQVIQYLANKYNPEAGYALPFQWDSNLPQVTN